MPTLDRAVAVRQLSVLFLFGTASWLLLHSLLHGVLSRVLAWVPTSIPEPVAFVAIALGSGTLVGAGLTVLQRPKRPAIVAGAVAGALAWTLGAILVATYVRVLFDAVGLRPPYDLVWRATTHWYGGRPGGGGVYSGWFAIAGGLMGCLWGALHIRSRMLPRVQALLWTALYTAVGAAVWAMVPVTYWWS